MNSFCNTFMLLFSTPTNQNQTTKESKDLNNNEFNNDICIDEFQASTSEIVPQFVVYNISDKNNNTFSQALPSWGFQALSSVQIWQMNRKKINKKPNLEPFVPLGGQQNWPILGRKSDKRLEKNGLTTRPYFSNPLFEKLPSWQFFNHKTKIIEPSDAQRYLSPLIIHVGEWKTALQQNSLCKLSENSISESSGISSACDVLSHTEELETSLSPSSSSTGESLSSAEEDRTIKKCYLVSTPTKTNQIVLNSIRQREDDSAMFSSCSEETSTSSDKNEVFNRKNIRRLSRGTRTRNASKMIKYGKIYQTSPSKMGDLCAPCAPTCFVNGMGKSNNTLDISRMDVLSEKIMEFHQGVEQTQNTLNRKLHLRDLLYYTISPISDAVVVLSSIMRTLQTNPLVADQQLILAKVPILRIKFGQNFSDITVDLNANNSVAIRNTHLLCYYSSFDWRVRPLVAVVKEWAKRRGINDANRSSFTSYSLVLLVIHYLQCGADPPVLPSLQELYPRRFHQKADVRGLNVSLPLDPPAASVWDFSERLTLSELLIGFLHYYAFSFNFDADAISVRLGRKTERAVVARNRSPYNHLSQWHCICIEEPFTFSNTAHSVYDERIFDSIKRAFLEGYNELDTNRELNSFLGAKPEE